MLLVLGPGLCAFWTPVLTHASTTPGSVLAWGIDDNGEVGNGALPTRSCYCVPTLPAEVK